MQNIKISFESDKGWDDYGILKDIVDQTNTNINALDASVYVTIFDTSLGNISKWDLAQDASIGVLMARDTTDDTSLGNLSHWEVTQDASIVALRTYTDGSLATRDTSLGNLSHWNVTQDASKAVIDTSLGNLSHWEVAQDASLLTRLHIYTGTFGGLKDASGVNGDVIYNDSGSALYLKLNSSWLKINASINAFG